MRSVAASTVAALMIVVAGCGATIRSTTNASSAELSKYKTYSFYTPTYKQGQGESIADQAIQSALKQDLASKGLTEATGNPDFLVAYHVKEQQKFEDDTVGYGFYGMGGPGEVTTYTQGTLIVDFIDPQTKKVFWRGTGSEVVNHPNSPNTNKIDKAVGQIIDRYPAPMAATPRTTM